MRVWILTVGEPLPTDPGHQRLHRSGILASLLAERGVDVVWWTSAFRHSDKTFRFPATTWQTVGPHLRICSLASRPYQRNVSIARIFANRDIAAEFRRLCDQESPPDVVLASYPIPEMALAGAQYACRIGVPAVIDVRDLWPDVWIPALPSAVRPIGRIAALPFFWQARRTLNAFQGICGITDQIVAWGLERAGRRRGKWDRAFPLAYAEDLYPAGALEEGRRFWADKLSGLPPARLQLCFFGNIAIQRARIDVMLDAMRRLPPDVSARTRLVLCGTGEDYSRLQLLTKELPQVVVPGWITGPQIEALSEQSHAGILPYPSDPDFSRSIPNKAVEYLAHSLPILTSLKGPVSELIERESCGMLYRETDPADLADKIVALFREPGQLAELAANARRTFEEQFKASSIYGALADMLAELAATRGR